MPADEAEHTMYRACYYKGKDIYTMTREELLQAIKELTISCCELEQPHKSGSIVKAYEE